MEKAVLVSLARNAGEKVKAEESLRELEGLVRAAGAEVLDKVLQVRPSIDPKTYIGEGKVEEIGWLAEDKGADLVVFDVGLSPSQGRNLEKALGVRVVDRTQVILDIFGRRARSNEGKLQVELAQLSYLLPRLTGRGVEMSRLGGGIGTRGPGETKLEVDRRRIELRVSKIKDRIRDLQKRRSGQRASRRKSLIPMVALVGYTSVGKSTLFNRLAKESTWTSPQLFATLDPLVRRAHFPDGATYFLSDTVGFIKKLPTELVAAFKATLEEVLESDFILHVIDHGSEASEAQAAAVTRILDEIGAGDIPRLRVFNKIDVLPDAAAWLARNDSPEEDSVYVSARTEAGLDALERRLRAQVYRNLKTYDLRLPRSRADLLESLARWTLVLKKREDGDYYVVRIMADPKGMTPFLPYIEGGRGGLA
jgi:GTP-binding protein HflX